jgi:hypothetical protein
MTFCGSEQKILSEKSMLYFTSFGRVHDLNVDAEILISLSETKDRI